MQGARTLDVVASAKSFASLLLPQHIEQALREAGFRRPSPVQEAALPLARLGTDLIVQAKAGTGKTLVFAVAAVERVDLSNAAPQVLVLAPTREIALQASEAVALVAAALPPPGLACGSFIGGLPVEEDEKQLRRACHVAVGTTGRVLSLIQRGALRCDALRMLVLDEADKLLGDSFRKDVLAIAAALPARRQTLALSATYAPAALDQLRRLMRGQQQEVRLCAEDTSLLGVRQCYRLAGSGGSAAPQQAPRARPGSACGSGEQLDARVAALLQLLSSVSFQQAVVFCKYTADAEEVAERLLAAGYPAAYLSGQRSQLQRIEALNALRDFRLRVAVSTDLAARGVDLDRINLVVNLELPTDAATYMHRVGRAGRFGTRGVAVTLLEGPEQLGRLEGYLQEVAGGQVVELPEVVPEEWYWQPVPAGASQAAAASAAGMAHTLGAEGPDTPAGGGGLLAASLAAGSLTSGGGPLADIATASLWLGEEEGGEEAQAAGLAAAAAERAAAASAGEEQGSSTIEVSYQVVPKPASRGTLAGAAATLPSPTAAAAGAAKPAVSSLTAAVAAAEASQHRRLEEAVNGCSDSEDSWASTSDDEYSGGSGSEGEGTAAPHAHAPGPGATAHPLRRNSSCASMGSAGSSGSSSGSGRLSSPPAPIPGRSQQQPGEEAARPPWQNSYEEGGRLAAVADAAEGGLASGDGEAAPQLPRHCRGSSGSGDEEPSFRDSWLTEEQQQAAAAEKQRARAEAAEAAPSASSVDLRPHRRSAAHAAARPSGTARPAAAAARLSRQAAQQRAARHAPPAQRQPTHGMPPQQQEEQRRGHYWDVVSSVEQDVRSRLASGSAGAHPASPAASAATSGTAAAQPAAASAPAAADEGESSDEEFAPIVPRQRRPLGSAQASAARRRQEEAAAARAAEAAALEMMAAAQDAEEEGADAHLGASAAAPAGDAAAAAAVATAAEQQRQWSEFWMQHYAYYGCYPSEGLFSASAPAAVPATEAAPPAVEVTGAAPAASATLPPPPPSPPAPPPMLSAAAWACQPPEGAEPQTSDPTSAAGAAAAGSGAEGGWVSVPAALLSRYQQLEWQNWHRQYSEWQSMWEQYKQYWHALYSQQQQLEQQQYQQPAQ